MSMVIAAVLTALSASLPATTPVESFPVTIRVDAGKPLGPLTSIWRFFGGDEPNYATMKDGRKLLRTLGELRPKGIYFRTHNLLNSGDGTPALKWGSTNAYTEDAQGRPMYDWTVVDLIFDTYLERGVRPYVEIGFMPKALSTKPDPYQHDWRPGLPYGEIYTGWAYPPRDYSRWAELVYQWVRHCVDRYGEAEVATWYWETWNEASSPNTASTSTTATPTPPGRGWARRSPPTAISTGRWRPLRGWPSWRLGRRSALNAALRFTLPR